MYDPWHLYDDRVVRGKDDSKNQNPLASSVFAETFFLSRMVHVCFDDSSITSAYIKDDVNLDTVIDLIKKGMSIPDGYKKALGCGLPYAKDQGKEAKIAFEYIKAHSLDRFKDIEKPDNGEFKMRCNTCGTIFCYTIDDLERNREAAKKNAVASLGQIGAFFEGNQAARISLELDKEKIVDYSRCPKCNSIDVCLLSEADVSGTEGLVGKPIGRSIADEIRSFRSLADDGIITEEEFEAKKKELLGL